MCTALNWSKNDYPEFLENENSDWGSIRVVSIGSKSHFEIPTIKVGVLKFGKKHLLLHIYAESQCICFKSLKLSGSYIVVGFGEMVHFINVESELVVSKKLDGYFGYARRHRQSDWLAPTGVFDSSVRKIGFNRLKPNNCPQRLS